MTAAVEVKRIVRLITDLNENYRWYKFGDCEKSTNPNVMALAKRLDAVYSDPK